MGTKDNPGKFNCYAAALPDEPIFILRSTDKSAPFIVQMWAEHYKERKIEDGSFNDKAREKYFEALETAEAMRNYHKHFPDV